MVAKSSFSCWLQLVLVFCTLQIISTRSAEAEKVALLVGVNQYDKRGLAKNPLEFAERDVDALSAVLKENGFAVNALRGSDRGKSRATKKNIELALSGLLKGRNAKDIVLVGFAGHGQQLPLTGPDGRPIQSRYGRTQEDAFYCPVDAIRSDPETLISLTKLLERLDRQGGINLVMVDACRDNPDPGRGARSISGNELNGRLPTNTAILFSCSAGQQALETKDAGGGHGVFFHQVIQGLKGDAANSRGLITWGRLVSYVRENVNSQAIFYFPERAAQRSSGLLQTPHELRNLNAIAVLSGNLNSSVAPSRRSKLKLPSLIEAPFSSQEAGVKQREWAAFLGRSISESDSTGANRTLIPAGKFMMGSKDSALNVVRMFPGETPDTFQGEHPRHRVTISSPFFLGSHEVTRGQFRQFVNATSYVTDVEKGTARNNPLGTNDSDNSKTWKATGQQGLTDRHPVAVVSWQDAQAFCKWLSGKEKTTVRLATQAEWEYACRAGSTSRFWSGDDPVTLAKIANVPFRAPADGSNTDPLPWNPDGIPVHDGYGGLAPIGQFRPNSFGLYDMHGNVWEWCQDGYDSLTYTSGGALNPRGNAQANRYAIRGACYL